MLDAGSNNCDDGLENQSLVSGGLVSNTVPLPSFSFASGSGWNMQGMELLSWMAIPFRV